MNASPVAVEYFSWESVAVAIVIIATAFGLFNLVASAWQNYKKLKAPSEQHDEQIMKFLKNDKARLDRLEVQANEQAEATKLMLKSMMQLMNHELDGNHIDKLVEMRDKLNDYLVEK